MLENEELPHFLLLYGSETGQAKAIAEQINDNSNKYGVAADLHCLSQTDKKKSHCVVIVVSTTGDGEPPQTVTTFWRRIRKRTLPSDYLNGVNYALLALGDSNYNNFCNCGKTLDKRLQELGAKKFYPTGYGDDAVDLEDSVEPWIKGLWPALRKQLNISCKNSEIVTVETENIQINIGKVNITERNEKNDKINRTDFTDMDSSLEEKKEKNVMLFNKTANSYEKDLTQSTQTNQGNSFKMENLSKSDVSKDDEDLISHLVKLSLSDVSVTLSSLPASFLKVIYQPELNTIKKHDDNFLPMASSLPVSASVVLAKRLTFSPDVKTTLQLTIKIQDACVQYEPGDSFGFLCCNSEKEVRFLLTRLKLIDKADTCCQIKIQNPSRAKQKTISHLPETSTLTKILSECCEIRAVPKKSFLRLLSEYTSNKREKKRLNELCSKEGSTEYMKYIYEPHACLLDLLMAFPSCDPPIEAVLENLPRLKPRFYSVASSPLENPNHFNIVFNLIQMKSFNSTEQITGVCTGWLSNITNHMHNHDLHEINIPSQNEKDSSMFEDNYPIISIYKRNNPHFLMPKDSSVPLIMVGPGTGVAPFIGFLQHRKNCAQQSSETSSTSETWLFYGCRYREKDHLFKNELDKLHSEGILTKLLVSYSREPTADLSAKYVQHNIFHYAVDIVRLIKMGALIYVCGDAKNMSQDVFKAFIEAWKTTENCSMEEATEYMKKLQDEKCYLQDVWT